MRNLPLFHLSKSKNRKASTNPDKESPIEIDDEEQLWYDIHSYIQQRIQNKDILMYTDTQKKKFWLDTVTSTSIHIIRDDSTHDYEDTPKEDFIDIWKDLINQNIKPVAIPKRIYIKHKTETPLLPLPSSQRIPILMSN
jgi:ribosomal protein L11 methylase PrmA